MNLPLPRPRTRRRPIRALAALFALGAVCALPALSGEGALDAGAFDAGSLDVGSPATPDEAGPAAPVGSEVDAGPATDDRRLALFRAELSRLMAAGSRSERWGLLVVSLDHGDTVYAWNAHEPLAPASNMKLFTSAAALHLLGPDFRFPTYLLADGPVVNGVLEGDLVLYGTGDPELGSLSTERPSDAFAAFVEAVQAAGIREIRGTVLGDGTHFTGDPRRPSWNPADLDNWYAAPVSALSFNENMVTLRVAPERAPGLPTTVRTIPDGAAIPLRNQSRVSSSGGDRLAMFRSDPDAPIQIAGTMRPRQVEAWRSLTVSDPPAYAASVLAGTLEAAGIRVIGRSGSRSGSIQTASRVSGRTLVAPALAPTRELRTLAIHRSAPVSELLNPVNKRSHNLYAEVLLHAMARIAGETPDFEGGARTLQRFLVDEVGVDGATLHVEDGSGLSRLNRTSAAGLIRLLAFMDASRHSETFTRSLPVAGNRRELSRMQRTPAAGNLVAKTGTISRTSALSGVVRGADGERLAFSILVNDVPSTWAAKRAEDRIGAHLAGFRRGTPLPLSTTVSSLDAGR
jgi:serine-type D-Ala-D-Ala carboxypeptidase/endopeptidase (penicillin-binding protein 4)